MHGDSYYTDKLIQKAIKDGFYIGNLEDDGYGEESDDSSSESGDEKESQNGEDEDEKSNEDKDLNKNGSDQEKLNEDLKNKKLSSYPNVNEIAKPKFEDLEREFFSKQFFILMRYTNVPSGADSVSEQEENENEPEQNQEEKEKQEKESEVKETEQKEEEKNKDQNLKEEQKQKDAEEDENKEKNESEKKKKKSREFKKNFHIYVMSKPDIPIADFPIDFSINNTIVGEFLKTVDATLTTFTEENDYPDLVMYRNQPFIKKDKSITKHENVEEKLKARYIFTFSAGYQRYKYVRQFDKDFKKITTETDTQNLQSFNDNEQKYYFDHSLQIQCYRVENVILPGQMAPCSYNQYVIWNYYDNFNLVYPFWDSSQEIEIENDGKQVGKKQAFSEYIKQKIQKQLKIADKTQSSDIIFFALNERSLDSNKNHMTLQFCDNSVLDDKLKEIMKIPLNGYKYNFYAYHFNLIQGDCMKSIYQWAPDNDDMLRIDYIEDNLFTEAVDPYKYNFKYWPQKVSTEFMDQSPEGNPEISMAQKFMAKTTLAYNETIYRNSKYANVWSRTYNITKLSSLHQNEYEQDGYFQNEDFVSDDYNNDLIIEDSKNPGKYIKLKIKNFMRKETKKNDKGEMKTEEVEVENNTYFKFYHCFRNDENQLNEILFAFEINDMNIFLKKKLPLNKDEPLLTLKTKVSVMKKMKDFKIQFENIDMMTLLMIVSKEEERKKAFFPITLTYERITDNKFNSPFMPFIFGENHSYTNELDPQNLSLVFLNIIDMTTNVLCIQPPPLINQEICGSYLKIQRTSDRVNIEGNDEEFQTIYTFGYSSHKSGEVFQFFDVSLGEKFEQNKEKGLIVNTNIKYLGHQMIVSSANEQAKNSTYQFHILPLYCLKGKNLIGSCIAKEGPKNILFQLHRQKPDEKLEKISWAEIKSLIEKKKSKKNQVKQSKQEKIKSFYESRYKFKISRMMKFDIKKVHVMNSVDKNMYFQLVSVDFVRSFALGPYFNNFELFYLLKQTANSLLRMVPFTFVGLIKNGLNCDVEKVDYFQKLQCLNGLTISDLFLKDPMMITKAFKADSSKLMPMKSYLEEIYDDQTEDFRKQAIEIGFISNEQIFLRSDFTMINQIMRALNMGATMSANLFIDHILNLENKSHYQIELIKNIKQITSQKKIGNGIVQFFQQIGESASSNQICNFETKIMDENAPLFSNKQENSIKFLSIHNFQNTEREIVNHILDLENQQQNGEKKNDKNKKNKNDEDDEDSDQDKEEFDINNTIFDFRYIIFNDKFNNLKEEKIKKSFIFNDFALSDMINKMEGCPAIFNQQSIMRIIDYQWTETSVAMKRKFNAFIFFYLIPFICVCFINGTISRDLYEYKQDQESKEPKKLEKINTWPYLVAEMVLMSICLLAQIFFFLIELVQIREQGILNYIKQGFWNFIEFTQFFVFVYFYCHLIYLMSTGYQDDKGVQVQAIEVYLIATGFAKVMFFIRLFQQYGFLVQMIGQTMVSLLPFILFFFLWILYFSLTVYVLRVETGEDYPDLATSLQYIFMTYRNSIGDITTPAYGYLEKDFPDMSDSDQFFKKNFMIAVIWGIWLINQVLNLIILLNFLIAVISQVYDNVIADQFMYSYRHKSDLNREHFMLQGFLGNLKEFQIIAFQHQKEDLDDEDDVFAGFVATLKNFIKKNMKQLNARYDANDKKVNLINEQLVEIKSSMKVNTDNIENLGNDINNVKQNTGKLVENVQSILDQLSGKKKGDKKEKGKKKHDRKEKDGEKEKEKEEEKKD